MDTDEACRTAADRGNTIEFFGGPFDGWVTARPDALPALVPIPFDQVPEWLDPGTILVIVLFAVYRLGTRCGAPAYLYVGMMTFDQFEALAEDE